MRMETVDVDGQTQVSPKVQPKEEVIARPAHHELTSGGRTDGLNCSSRTTASQAGKR